jgi:NADH-quinone oxidoreductase subunit G
VEELHLLARLVRGLGSESIDHRTRHADFGNTAAAGKARWLGTSIAALSPGRGAGGGQFLRKDHPLLAQRIRQAVRHGAQLMSLHAVHDDWAMPVAAKLTAAPSPGCATGRGGRCRGHRPGRGRHRWPAEPVGRRRPSPRRCCRVSARPCCWAMPPRSIRRRRNCWRWRSGSPHTGASVGYLGETANGVGAQLVGALPGPGGLNAGQMLTQPMKALLLLNTEPMLDSADAAAARQALAGRAWWWR